LQQTERRRKVPVLDRGRREFITLIGGAAAAWPLAARAQQRSMPVIGFLSPGSPESDGVRLTGVRQGLKESGYVEGQNVAIEYRFAHGQNDRLPALAADLVNRPMVGMVTAGTPATLAAKAATATIPIVFNLGVDPVQFGLTASLNHPGGNLTGVVILSADLAAKKLEVLHELLPDAAVVAMLVNPTNPIVEPELRATQDAARSLGVQLHILRASTAGEIDAAFASLVKLRALALVVGDDSYFLDQRAQVMALATRHAVPTISGWREFPVAGGLMSYGGDRADAYRQVGLYAGKILKGIRPADLPVQQVVKIEMVVNLKTAKTLGITFPLPLIGRADEVIE
jgi:putative tryptophan/tyrosine transport system substrate-binding protein